MKESKFLFHVTTLKFEPVMVRIPTKDNFMADFISRNHDQSDNLNKFEEHDAKKMVSVTVPDDYFFFTADW